MEWNKAKKKLISKSNDNTVDKVELRLRSTVRVNRIISILPSYLLKNGLNI